MVLNSIVSLSRVGGAWGINACGEHGSANAHGVAMPGFFTVNCYSYTIKWDSLIRWNGVVVYCVCDYMSEHARNVGLIPCQCNFIFCITA